MRGSRDNFRFDRVFSFVGRINVSSGTSNAKELRRRDGILTRLFDIAQIEVLKAFREGGISIEQLVDADRAGRPRSAETRRRYYTSLKKLRQRSRLGKDAKVSDLSRRAIELSLGHAGEACQGV